MLPGEIHPKPVQLLKHMVNCIAPKLSFGNYNAYSKPKIAVDIEEAHQIFNLDFYYVTLSQHDLVHSVPNPSGQTENRWCKEPMYSYEGQQVAGTYMLSRSMQFALISDAANLYKKLGAGSSTSGRW